MNGAAAPSSQPHQGPPCLHEINTVFCSNCAMEWIADCSTFSSRSNFAPEVSS
jgi:hypothetical protein